LRGANPVNSRSPDASGRGLLAEVDRKNTWQMAEASRDVLQQVVMETFGDSEGIGAIDETGFL